MCRSVCILVTRLSNRIVDRTLNIRSTWQSVPVKCIKAAPDWTLELSFRVRLEHKSKLSLWLGRYHLRQRWSLTEIFAIHEHLENMATEIVRKTFVQMQLVMEIDNPVLESKQAENTHWKTVLFWPERGWNGSSCWPHAIACCWSSVDRLGRSRLLVDRRLFCASPGCVTNKQE